ncbi:Response regulator receiver domain-containing protein [Geoalkalibacter ferrihydriticus]|uniref:Chemotaxis protein CheY n=2 Tax=Geoalkalibacter ferrihydriticus TaxID=392333 RepID=A0A0C2HPY9_9BACT|nr:response regulator [Geoalkalibacter ferrihydriticus]KIH76960.1 chemotaxis protein CheY [Geoalkalibacter ferrihydriticus DSM 17813]SDL42414.1 Response regulator receiver domain-containing protein [Geoalkalibacter ferrihydriticus]
MGSSVGKILIVDDEENARIGLSRLLSQEGYDVDSVGDGREALDFIRDHRVSLVISDIHMPGMNGLVFLRELHRSHPGINVIMITAYGGVESYLEAMNLGAFEYINKPVKLHELKSVMNKLFRHGDSVTV